MGLTVPRCPHVTWPHRRVWHMLSCTWALRAERDALSMTYPLSLNTHPQENPSVSKVGTATAVPNSYSAVASKPFLTFLVLSLSLSLSSYLSLNLFIVSVSILLTAASMFPSLSHSQYHTSLLHSLAFTNTGITYSCISSTLFGDPLDQGKPIPCWGIPQILILKKIGNSGRKDPERKFTHKKIASKPPLSKTPDRGPSVFKKLRIRLTIPIIRIEKLHFRRDLDACSLGLQSHCFCTKPGENNKESSLSLIW